MRTAFALFALAFFLSLPFALTVEEFKAGCFDANETIAFKALKAEGAYSLVIANGNEACIFDSSAGALVKDRGKIAQILREDAYAKADVENTKLEASRFWSAYMMSKESGEETCNQYLGLDKYNCTDKVSCIRSCMSVPLCSPLVYVAGFIEGMQKWAKDRRSVTPLVDEFNIGIEDAFANGSGLQLKGGQLEGIIAQAASVKNNSIFWNYTDAPCKNGERCFAFCPKVDYAEKEAGSLAQKMLIVKSAVEGEATRVQRADAIYQKSVELEKKAAAIKGQTAEKENAGKSAPCIPTLAISGVLATVFILSQRKG